MKEIRENIKSEAYKTTNLPKKEMFEKSKKSTGVSNFMLQKLGLV